MKKRSITLTGVAVALAIFAALHVGLSMLIESRFDQRFRDMNDYEGSVADVDIHLWRGAYSINGLEVIKQTSGGDNEPFLDVREIDLSLDWDAIMDGELVTKAKLKDMEISFIEAEDTETSQTGENVDWLAYLEELVPFPMNEVWVEDSLVRFRTPGIDVEEALTARSVNARVTNIANIQSSEDEAYTRFIGEGAVMNAPLRIQGSTDPESESPIFDVNLTLQKVPLPAVNPWLREFINADAQAGSFELYLEIAAKGGEFTGYAKPIMQDVDMFRLEEATDNILQSVWEGLVDIAAELFENQEESQVAAQVPLGGSFEDPEIGTFDALASVLRNAFIGAFSSALEQSISLPVQDSANTASDQSSDNDNDNDNAAADSPA